MSGDGYVIYIYIYIYIARGQMDKAEEEGTRDRSDLWAAMSDVTPQQRREFMNWRNIHLKR